jgi:diphosphomevalonate decarboxylase
LSTDVVVAEMPSNIALIKYMGKVKGGERNKPTNSSLSLTLSHLRTRVEISPRTDSYDVWEPLPNEKSWIATKLSDRGRKRYLAHFEFLKQKLGLVGSYNVRSANNFPSDCGIASSASSFAALTQATYELAQSQDKNLDLSLLQLAELSRVGSGSSIRSFLSPLVLWNAQGISVLNVQMPELRHQVVVVDHEKKAIGSSDAHERVTTSLLFQGRPERAEKRLADLVISFEKQDWHESFQLIWAEFWDMHALFATSNPAFHYITPQSLQVLNLVYDHWATQNDGPWVTMDAGANIHLIYRADQNEVQAKLAVAIRSQLKTPVLILGETK